MPKKSRRRAGAIKERLMGACCCCDEEDIRRAIKKGGDPNSVDGDNWSPLMWALSANNEVPNSNNNFFHNTPSNHANIHSNKTTNRVALRKKSRR